MRFLLFFGAPLAVFSLWKAILQGLADSGIQQHVVDDLLGFEHVTAGRLF